MKDDEKPTCYKCGRPVKEGQQECPACAQGVPPGMQQAGEMMGQVASQLEEHFRRNFVPIDWDKVKDVDDLKAILKSAIPGVQRNTPQFYEIMRFLKL